MNRNKLFAVMATVFMLAVPLMVIDPDYSSSHATDSKDASNVDYRWKGVSTEVELKTALASGGSVKLTADITLNDTLVIGVADTTLNLGGKTISYNGSGNEKVAIKASARATIENGTVSASGCTGILVTGDVDLILLTVTQTGADTFSAVECNGNGILRVQNGTYTATGNAVLLKGNGGSVTINNGKFTAVKDTVAVVADTADISYSMQINGGEFNRLSTAPVCSSTGDKGAIDFQIFSGIFKGNVVSDYGTINIYGGTFHGTWTGLAMTAVHVFGGKFTTQPTELIDADSVWDGTNRVNQTKSVKIGNTYYNTLNDAIVSASSADTIEITKTGTYNMGTYTGNSLKILGKADQRIFVNWTVGLVEDDVPAASSNRDTNGETTVDIRNVILCRNNNNYQGFINGCSHEYYENVEFWGYTYLFSTQTATFKNCTINQYENCYSIDVYVPDKTVFDGCTFHSIGKSVLLYVDANKAYPGGLVYVNNTRFIDHGMLKDKGAIEVHTEWMGETYISDYSYWGIYIDDTENTTATGYYKDDMCTSNLWHAVNNDVGSTPLTLSNTTWVFVGDVQNYPTFTVDLMNHDGSTFKTIAGVKYGSETIVDKLDSVPTRTGYKFIGYFDKDRTTMYFDAEGNGVHKMDVKGNMTLYPEWTTVETYKVTYDINGGSGMKPVDTNEYNRGSVFRTASATNIAMEGYEFVGWSDGVKIYSADSNYVMGTSDISLKATWALKKSTPLLWNEITITVTDKYDSPIHGALVRLDDVAVGHTGSDGTLKINDVEKKVHSLVVNYGLFGVSKSVKADLTNNDNVKVKFESYTVGTNVKTTLGSDISVAVSDNINDIAQKMSEETKFKDATKVELQVVIDNSPQMADETKEQLEKMKSESGESEGQFFDVSVVLKYTENNEEKTAPYSNISKYGLIDLTIDMDLSTKSSYSIWHCHKNDDGTYEYRQLTELKDGDTPVDCSFKVVGKQVVVYANKFSEFMITSTESGTYTASFDVNGGSETIESRKNVVKIELPQYTGTKEGYEFAGWECNGTTYQSGEKVTLTGNTEFKAVWKEVGPEPGPGPEPEPTPAAEQVMYSIAWFLVLLAVLLGLYILGRRLDNN